MSRNFKAIALSGGYVPEGTVLGIFDNQYDADCVAGEHDVLYRVEYIDAEEEEGK